MRKKALANFDLPFEGNKNSKSKLLLFQRWNVQKNIAQSIVF